MIDTSFLPLALFILTVIGWIIREIWRWRKAKRLAMEDTAKTLKDKKGFLEELISKTKDGSAKHSLSIQLEETNAALLGFYAKRLRRTIKDAGLPPEETLIANGRSHLKPQQAARLKEAATEIKALPPFLSSQDLLVLGNAYYYMEQYQEAKNMYDKILGLNPDDPSTLNNRGLTYDKLERYDEALNDYNRSLEIRPDHPGTLNNRGTTYAKLERYDEALDDFNRSLELRPDHPDTLYNLACLFSLWGKADEALAYLEKAISGDKKYREMARTDEDFKNIRKGARFKKLVEPD